MTTSALDVSFHSRVAECVELLRDVAALDRLLWSDGFPLPVVADVRYPVFSRELRELAVSLVTGPRFRFLEEVRGSDSWVDLMAAVLSLPGLSEDDLRRLATSFDVWGPRALPRFLGRAGSSPVVLAEAFHGLRTDRGSFPVWDDPDALDRVLVSHEMPLVRAAGVLVSHGQLFYSDLVRLLRAAASLSLSGAETLERLVADVRPDPSSACTPMDRCGILDRLVVLAHAGD